MMTITCAICQKQRETAQTKTGEPRIPFRWKKIAGKFYCGDCKTKPFALRAVAIPVARCDWDTVRPLVRAGWSDCTRCANWLITQLYASDTLFAAMTTKLPAWKAPYLYPEARKQFNEIEPTTLASLINTVQNKYRSLRWDLWRRAASLPTFRQMPIPINSQSWELERVGESSNEFVFHVRLGGERHELALRRDGQFSVQHSSLALIAAGDLEAGEASLYEVGSSLMLKIAAWFPKRERTGAKTVRARTCTDGFLIATEGERIWRLNGDHVQRWIVGSDCHQQRLREDMKAERRFPREMRDGIVERMAFLSQKRRDKLASWMHESSHSLVAWAARQRAATLIWDDSYPSMFLSFPWFVFSQRIEQKCTMAGIEFVKASEYVAPVQEEAISKK